MNQLEMADPSLTGAKTHRLLTRAPAQPWMRSMLTRSSTTLTTIIPHCTNQRRQWLNDKCIGDACKKKAKTSPVTAALQSAGNMLTNHRTMVMFLHKMSRTHKPKDAESRIVTAWGQERVVCLAHLTAHLFPSPPPPTASQPLFFCTTPGPYASMQMSTTESGPQFHFEVIKTILNLDHDDGYTLSAFNTN